MRSCILVLLLVMFTGTTGHCQLPLPTIPAQLNTPAKRADYLAMHFYDGMNWSDPVMASNDNIMQDWANYLSVLPHCTTGARDSSIVAVIHSIPARFIPTYADFADTYLFATESELFDETTYLKVLAALATHPEIETSYKEALSANLQYLSHCAPGERATDITVQSLTDDSTTSQLEQLAGKAKYILIVFYDPDCEDCHETLHTLTHDYHWIDVQKSGQLLIVKAEITDDIDNLYPIITVPSLYLLDGKSMQVIKRNHTLEQIEPVL